MILAPGFERLWGLAKEDACRKVLVDFKNGAGDSSFIQSVSQFLEKFARRCTFVSSGERANEAQIFGFCLGEGKSVSGFCFGGELHVKTP
jgi:hypothetical protein